MFAIFNSEQKRGQSDIIEVQFRRLDKSIGNICVIRLQEESHIAGFKKREPVSGRGMGDACVIGQAVDIEQMTDAPGT